MFDSHEPGYQKISINGFHIARNHMFVAEELVVRILSVGPVEQHFRKCLSKRF